MESEFVEVDESPGAHHQHFQDMNRRIRLQRQANRDLQQRLDKYQADAARYHQLKASRSMCGDAWIAIGISEVDPCEWDEIIDNEEQA